MPIKINGSQKEVQEDYNATTQCSSICTVGTLSYSVFFVEVWEHLQLAHFFFHHGGLEIEFLLSNSVAIAFICWVISQVLELLLHDSFNFYILIWHSHCTPLSRRLWIVDRAVMLGRRFSFLQLNWEQFTEDQYLLFQDWAKLGHALSREYFIDTNYILNSGNDVSVLKTGTINIEYLLIKFSGR